MTIWLSIQPNSLFFSASAQCTATSSIPLLCLIGDKASRKSFPIILPVIIKPNRPENCFYMSNIDPLLCLVINLLLFPSCPRWGKKVTPSVHLLRKPFWIMNFAVHLGNITESLFWKFKQIKISSMNRVIFMAIKNYYS